VAVCGCVVIGSERRLKDGPCGGDFPNEDANGLKLYFDLSTNPDKLSFIEKKAESHLSRHNESGSGKSLLTSLSYLRY